MPIQPRRKADFDRECFGCDSSEFLDSVRESPSYSVGGAGLCAVSILSDAQEMMASGDTEGARQAINRAKLLITEELVKPSLASREEAGAAAPRPPGP